MTSGESIGRTPEYTELFEGYMAFVRTFGSQPENDSDLPEARTHTLSGDELPAIALAQSIDHLSILYEPEHFDQDEAVLNPERVIVRMHQTVGVTREIWMSRKNGVIKPSLEVIPDNEEDIGPEISLSKQDQGEIIAGLLQGEQSWLELDTPAGEYARRLDFRMRSFPNVELDDLGLLQAIIGEMMPRDS